MLPLYHLPSDTKTIQHSHNDSINNCFVGLQLLSFCIFVRTIGRFLFIRDLTVSGRCVGSLYVVGNPMVTIGQDRVGKGHFRRLTIYVI